MCFVYVTNHANKRIKERLPKMKSAKRRMAIAEEAFNNGIRFDASKGPERQYIKKCMKDKPEYKGYEYVLYALRIFVFNDGNLITILPCENQIKRRIESVYRKKNRQIIGHNCYKKNYYCFAY